ncbi:MAG TPA: hypothetical protein EYP67_01505 [Methanosarcinales archaeon]|nr:hypothetical protein [Methanosarcinales archaeon]
MKKTVLISAMLLFSMVFSASVLAENDGVVATSSGKTVKMAGGTPGGADWGYPSPFTFYPRGPGYSRMSLLFDTLTWKDADGVIPALADGWKVSDDGKEWTLYLDRNARWHDGELFTADDVEFTFEYMEDHEGESTWFDSTGYIDDVEVVDDYTVIIRLNEPMASFLVDIAGNVPIIPAHIWKDVSDPLTFKDDDAVIGTGPMKLVEYDSAMGSYQYEANYDYYDGKIRVDEFISMEVADTAAALQTGEVDEVSFWGAEITAKQTFEGDPDFEIITGPSFWVLQVIFNCEKYPNNISEFRQAIAHGIDRDEIVSQVLNGGGMAANTGIMHPDSIWYNPDCTVYEYEPDTANDTLDSLGFVDTDGNGIRNYPESSELSGDVRFDLYTIGRFSREAELMEDDLLVIGIGVDVKTIDWGTIDGYLKDGNFDVAISGHGGIANPQIMRVPDWPASTYHSDDYDSIYAAQEVEMDFDTRKEFVNQLQEMVADDLPVYTLYHPYMWCVYDPEVLDTWFYTRDGICIGIPLELNKLIFLARYGDANENGKINMQDVTAIERMILGLDEETDMADANQNNRINMQDATHIELIMLGRAPIRTP